MIPSKLKVGIVGLGRMGENHLKKLLVHPSVESVAVVDASADRLRQIQTQYKVTAFTTPDLLFYEVDALVIAAPTPLHYPLAKRALESGVHVLIEKPITETYEQAIELTELAHRNGLQLHSGYVEHFRLKKLLSALPETASVSEAQFFRLNTSIGRDPSIDVIQDLTVHDIDLAFLLFGTDVSHCSCSGFKVVTDKWDEVAGEIVFRSGKRAHFITSRVSDRVDRRLRLLGDGLCVDVDFSSNTVAGKVRNLNGEISSILYKLGDFDALSEEIHSFLISVQGISASYVDGRTSSENVLLSNRLRSLIHEGLPKDRGLEMLNESQTR